jgi:hypothetical protein
MPEFVLLMLITAVLLALAKRSTNNILKSLKRKKNPDWLDRYNGRE